MKVSDVLEIHDFHKVETIWETAFGLSSHQYGTTQDVKRGLSG